MSTLLQRNLFDRRMDPQSILCAIEGGEVNTHIAIQANPHLLAQALDKWKRGEPFALPKQAAQLNLWRALEERGANPWSGWGDYNVLTLAYRTHNGPLFLWLARHARAPKDLFADFLRGFSTSPFFGAQEGMIRALASLGAPVNVRDEKGSTPLHQALSGSQVAALVDAGVDGYTVNHEGMDARDAWDHMKLSSSVRKEMEYAFIQRFPMKPEKSVRNFSQHIALVGVARAKSRLKEAGVNPITAHWNGFGLVEIVIAHILNHELDKEGLRRLFDRDKRRLDRQLRSVLDLVRPHQQETKQREVIQAALDLVDTSHTPTSNSEATFLEPLPILNKQPLARRLDHCMDLIERMVEHRLIENASFTAASLTAKHISDLTKIEWLAEDSKDQPRLLRLLSMATRGLWDEAWLSVPRHSHSPLARLPVDFEIIHQLIARPRALGVIILTQTRTRTDMLDGLGSRIISEVAGRGIESFHLTHQDNPLVEGVCLLKQSKQNALRQLGGTIEREMQRQDMHRQTALGTHTGRVHRL